VLQYGVSHVHGLEDMGLMSTIKIITKKMLQNMCMFKLKVKMQIQQKLRMLLEFQLIFITQRNMRDRRIDARVSFLFILVTCNSVTLFNLIF
jgi:hypothetical protein